jgi:hypothetical protein
MIEVCYGKKEVLVCEINVVVGEEEKGRDEGTKWVEQPRRQNSKRSEADLELPVSVEIAGKAVETSQ